MVLRGLTEEEGVKSMATTPNRSNPLHNFSLKWGRQRKMRCVPVFSAGAGSSGGGDRRSSGSKSEESTATRERELDPPRGEKRQVVNDNGIAAVRQKLMLDLKTAADRMKDAILKNEEEEEDEEALRPWNLRKSRTRCKASDAAGIDRKGLKIDEKKHNFSSPVTPGGAVKLPKLRSSSDKREERVKFSVQLSKKEIEEDFMLMLNRKPPRRPNKRPKLVQKQIDTLLPGLWLTEVTVDSYKVVEAAQNGKVRHSRKRKVL